MGQQGCLSPDLNIRCRPVPGSGSPAHSLFSLTGHLRLELGLLAEIAVRPGSSERIKVLLPNRKEDATEIGWDTSARTASSPHHSQALLRLTKPVRVDRGDTHHVFYGWSVGQERTVEETHVLMSRQL
jgi:hypothetical protein